MNKNPGLYLESFLKFPHTLNLGKYGETNSDGLSVVAGNIFSFSLGSESDEILVGTITGNTMTGSFKFPSNPFAAVISGTFTITKK
jgi:hypothetical protein